MSAAIEEQLEELFNLPSPARVDDPITVVKEEPEKSKTCSLLRRHPADPDGPRERCGRLAVYEITLGNKPCEHPTRMYVCQGCWNDAEVPGRRWTCLACEPNQRYEVKPAITAWRKL